MKPTYYIYILFIAIGLAACNGSKSLAKKGLKLEEAGMTDEAAQSYYMSLYKKRTNVDAQIGLKKNGQLLYMKKLEQFLLKKNSNDLKGAVYSFLEAKEYCDMVGRVGVTLNTPDYYLIDFENVKNAYLESLYEEGTGLLEDEKFEVAEGVFYEISKLDPDYKDAGALKDIAYLEPLYKAGVSALEHSLFREAYYNFDKVIKKDRTYKDAGVLQQEAQQRGTFTLAMLPFENSTGKPGMDTKMSAYIQNALLSSDDPFLKLVDRDNLALILEEQKLSLSGIIDQETASSVGELLGAKAIITGNVLNYTNTTGRMVKNKKRGFEQYQLKRYNAETEKNTYETKYRQVDYMEYKQTSEAHLGMQIKVVSLETGEILLSKIVERTTADEVHYADFSGNKGKLYPSVNGKLSTRNSDKNYLSGLLGGKRTLTTGDQLALSLYKVVTNEVTHEVDDMLVELIR